MSTVDEFIKLRGQVIEQIVPLLESGDMAPQDKFELYAQLARNQGSFDLYHKAFQALQGLEAEQKMTALTDLLTDVDAEIQELTTTEGDDIPVTQEEPVSQDQPAESQD